MNQVDPRTVGAPLPPPPLEDKKLSEVKSTFYLPRVVCLSQICHDADRNGRRPDLGRGDERANRAHSKGFVAARVEVLGQREQLSQGRRVEESARVVRPTGMPGGVCWEGFPEKVHTRKAAEGGGGGG